MDSISKILSSMCTIYTLFTAYNMNESLSQLEQVQNVLHDKMFNLNNECAHLHIVVHRKHTIARIVQFKFNQMCRRWRKLLTHLGRWQKAGLLHFKTMQHITTLPNTLQHFTTLYNITQYYLLQQYRKTGLLHSAKFYKSFVEFYNTIQSNTCHHSPSLEPWCLWFCREFYNIIQSNSGRVAALQIQADFYDVQFEDSTIFNLPKNQNAQVRMVLLIITFFTKILQFNINIEEMRCQAM